MLATQVLSVKRNLIDGFRFAGAETTRHLSESHGISVGSFFPEFYLPIHQKFRCLLLCAFRIFFYPLYITSVPY